MLISYIFICAGMSFAGKLFKLERGHIVSLLVYAYILTPYILLGRAKSLYYQRKFWDVNKYMEKMLYYFKGRPKLLECWGMVLELFPEGEMNTAIKDAIGHVKISDNLETGKAEAIQDLSKRYQCSRLLRIHEFFMQVERDGGNYDMSIELLLKDRQLWAERVEELQQKKKFTRVNIVLSMLIVTVLCLSIMYLPEMVASNVTFADIGKIRFVQLSAMGYLMLMLFLYVSIDRKMCIDWLKDENLYTEGEAEARYEKLTSKDMSFRARLRRHTCV